MDYISSTATESIRHHEMIDEGITYFIERILSGEPRKPQGETVRLEDISYKKAWQK